MTQSEPIDFSLLPGDPLNFFGLQHDYERNDLRRVYGKYIRQFKPDSSPREFQLIRSAYEQLETQLRYRGSLAEDYISQPAASWGSAERPAADASTPPTRTVAERLETEPLDRLYQELSQQAGKQPIDFYTLAVLSEVTRTEDPLVFVKWLLAGAKACPRDLGLAQLLREYLATEVSTRQLPQLVLAVAKTVHSDRFYFITEPALLRLLREIPFHQFRQLLANCEAQIRDHRVQGKLAFYLRILPPAVWLADPQWVSGIVAALEEHSAELGSGGEQHLEFALSLLQFAQRADEFQAGDPVRQQIVAAVRAYCCEEVAVAWREVVHCNARLAADAFATMAAFPEVRGLADDEEPGEHDWQQLLNVWNWVSLSVADDLGLLDAVPEAPASQKPALITLREMRDEVAPLLNQHHSYTTIVSWAWRGAFLALPLMLLGWLPHNYLVLVGVGWAVAVLTSYQLYWQPKWFHPWSVNQLIKRINRLYESTWRPRMFSHQAAVGVSPQAMVDQLSRLAEETQDQWFDWVLALLQNDQAFRVYATALLFAK